MRIPASVAALLLTMHASAQAAIITIDTDPFAGSTAPTTPGRQIVPGEPSITFNPATDVFEIALSAFGPYGFGPTINFANSNAAGLPTGGVNVIVLEEFPASLAAGGAADLIAARITTPTPGFFVYFNTGIGFPRLVFSTDLNDNTADLKIIARMTNLNAASLASFTAQNFAVAVPEPSAIFLLATGALWFMRRSRRS
jgi:hypothetical protein